MSNITTVNASTIQTSTSSSLSSSSSPTTSSSSSTSSSTTTTVTSPSLTTVNQTPNDDMIIIISVAVTVLLVITVIIIFVVIRRKRSTNNPHNTLPARSDLVPENVDIQDPEQCIKRRASEEEQDKSPSHTDPQQTEFQERLSVASDYDPPNYTNYLNHKSIDSEREQSVYLEMSAPNLFPKPCLGPENKSRYVNMGDNDDNQGIYVNDDDQSENYVLSENTSDDIYVNTAFEQGDYVNAPEKQKPK